MHSKNILQQQPHKNRLKYFFLNHMRSLTISQDATQQKPLKQLTQHDLLRTKTLKKPNYFQTNLKSLSQQQKISQKKSQSSIGSSVLSQLANYINEKNTQFSKKKIRHWEDALIDSSDQKQRKSQKQRNNQKQKGKTQRKQEYSNTQLLQNSYYSETFVGQNKKQKQEKREKSSFSKTQSIINSSKSITQSPKSYKHYFQSLKKHEQKYFQQESDKKSETSSMNSSQLLDFYIKLKQQQKQQKQKQNKQQNTLFNPKKRKNYIDDDQQNQQLFKQQKELRKQLSEQQYLLREFLISPKRKNPEEYKQQKICFANYQRDFLFQQDMRSVSTHKNRLQVVQTSYKRQSTDKKSNHQNKNSSCKHRRLRRAKQQQSTCSICIDQIYQRAKLPCKHSFCRECLLAWVEKNSKCPNCRVNAEYYIYNDEQYQIEPKQFQLQNYINNIGQNSQQDQISLNYQCYNCDHTSEGDQLLICDRCLVSACHVDCDPALNGRMPPQDREWFCHICRLRPNIWFRELID